MREYLNHDLQTFHLNYGNLRGVTRTTHWHEQGKEFKVCLRSKWPKLKWYSVLITKGMLWTAKWI